MAGCGIRNEKDRLLCLRELLKRCTRALGENSKETCATLYELGCELEDAREFDEANGVWKRCLTGRMKTLGPDHKDTLSAMNNLGSNFDSLGEYERAMHMYENCLHRRERVLGKAHPDYLMTQMNVGALFMGGLNQNEKALGFFQQALEGYIAALGKDDEDTKRCATNTALCLAKIGEKGKQMLRKILSEFPHIAVGQPAILNYT